MHTRRSHLSSGGMTQRSSSAPPVASSPPNTNRLPSNAVAQCTADRSRVKQSHAE